ncbi:uncharacterized protein I303_106405 [Kwoniella dejecticola CBS 10117]|uniref:Major facilitator superfamily (MFS) profile domain-containing protein n=1 Tax=Kwoniella dejecticola CBS 10117 TaxID=1296121 RepID=A0A1A5ZUT3_9TREE|nr:uncharacterized protein I303_08336 [Kwoniella dejecticola CBS 10117]OBR81566.1 hypothetical protein I303_08336 [Kwoniella dejecticola CBS 10117]
MTDTHGRPDALSNNTPPSLALNTEQQLESTMAHQTNSIERSPVSKMDFHLHEDIQGEKNISSDGEGVIPTLSRHPDTPHSPSTVAAATLIPIQTKVYKRRFFGLIQLSLLNIIVSWCWLTFSAVSRTSSEFFGVSESDINWLSTGFLFAFVIASPAALWVLNHKGCKAAMCVSAVLLVLGAWIRYLGAKLASSASSSRNPSRFGIVVLGQIMIGFAQPFVLSAPTRLSHEWFSERGRITATALASLCNPLGGALGQLIGPFIATEPGKVPNMVLYVAIITTVICIPSFFLPSAPPLPPTITPFKDTKITFRILRELFSSLTFHLIAWPFVIYVAAFNSTSSLLNQILEPYGLTEDQAGIDGAVMIVVGLLAAAIASPLLDRFGTRGGSGSGGETNTSRVKLIVIKILVLIICASYILFIFVPKSGKLVGPAIISALVGSASFILLPLALELLADTTWPIGPEVSSTICWSISQLAGGILLISMTALKGNAGDKKEPDKSMFRAMILQAIICVAVAPLALCLGYWGTGTSAKDKKDDITSTSTITSMGMGTASRTSEGVAA